MTFTKDNKHRISKISTKDKLLFETDIPTWTSVPFRGTICQPVHVIQFGRRNPPEDLKSQYR